MSTYRKKVKIGSLIILNKRVLKEKFLKVKKIHDDKIELLGKAGKVAIRKIKGTLEEPYFIFNNSRYNLDLG